MRHRLREEVAQTREPQRAPNRVARDLRGLRGPTLRRGRLEGGLINAALNVAMNAHLEAFGVKVTEAATAFVAQHGLKVVTDPERAKKLSLINFNETAGEAMTALGGVWYAPEGSTKHLDSSSTILFGKRAFIEAADDTHTPNEAFVFISGSIYEGRNGSS